MMTALKPSNTSDALCRMCGSSQVELVYDGRMRHSGVGSDQTNDHVIYNCSSCLIEFIEPFPQGVDNDYAGTYWQKKGLLSEADLERIHAKALCEGGLWLEKVGVDSLANRSVLDFGCGSGAFLDIVKGMASETIGIERDPVLSSFASSRGHQIYASVDDALEKGVKTDFIVSFDVVEHLVDPIGTLRSFAPLMAAEGALFIGVPNQRDVIKDLVPDYLPHFYHVEHLWYFDENSLRYLFEKSDYCTERVGFLHKYNFMNIVEWARTGKAPGTPHSQFIDRDLDQRFCGWLEDRGVASHLFAKVSLNSVGSTKT